MASPTRWTWVWVNSGSWWWTGRPGVLQFMGLQRVRHDWVTELNWLLGRKIMTNLDSIFKSRDITLPTRVHLVKAMVFLVIMYGWESWTTKKAEGQRIDAFELWCWWRLLRVPWTTRRSNQSILKEISLEYSLEGRMLKLKLQYFGHLMWRTDSGKDLDDGKDWKQEEKGMTEDEMAGWHHQLDGRESEWLMGVGDGQGGLACCSPWGHKESDTTEWLNWTEIETTSPDAACLITRIDWLTTEKEEGSDKNNPYYFLLWNLYVLTYDNQSS